MAAFFFSYVAPPAEVTPARVALPGGAATLALSELLGLTLDLEYDAAIQNALE